MYIDKNDIKFWLKIVSAGIIIILFFTVIIPKWQQINKAFDMQIKRFVGLIFQTSESFTHERPSNYLIDELKQMERDFKAQFVTISSKKQIKFAIINGENLLDADPENKSILRKLAFLYYVSRDYETAQKYYEKILDSYPKRKRTFENLKGEDSRTVKNTLIELAALNYELGNTRIMIDLYEQYLRASNRKSVYKDLADSGIDQKRARFEVFSNMASDSLLYYIKAIEMLEDYGKSYPEDDLFFRLGTLNYNIVSIYAQDDFTEIQEYFYNAEYYFKMIIDTSDEYRKKLIIENLEKLEEIKRKIEKNNMYRPDK
jgi:tetratricopeptide (TPR) repeat protein